MTNGNGWTKWLIGALWGVIILWSTSLTSNLVAVDKDSRNRDDAEACQREYINREVVRIDTNQKEVIKKVDKILDNQEKLLVLIPIVSRLETKIERIQ